MNFLIGLLAIFGLLEIIGMFLGLGCVIFSILWKINCVLYDWIVAILKLAFLLAWKTVFFTGCMLVMFFQWLCRLIRGSKIYSRPKLLLNL